jgi:N-acetylglucosamine-6-phosphate deacetylase
MSGGNTHAVAADVVFDGDNKHQNAAVLIEGSHIVQILPTAQVPDCLSIHTLPPGKWLAPGFIDLQVNGGGDALFNDAPTPETILTMAAAHRAYGTTSLLPTLISDSFEKMQAAMAAAQSLMQTSPSVLGIHFEGPFLAPEKAGVHDPVKLRSPSSAEAELLCANKQGVLLVTLAPESVPNGFIRQLVRTGARVALGHSMASYEETRSAMADGLTGFTHLFNAMRPLGSREPGPVAAALETSEAYFGMIADGFHVHPAMLRLALRGCGRPMLVTDAMPPVGGRGSHFRLYGAEIQVRDGRCLRSDGTLAGALLDMATAVRNCVRHLDVGLEEALRFASRNPADFLGLGHMLGRLAPGYRADLVAIDPYTLGVLDTWVAGQQ